MRARIPITIAVSLGLIACGDKPAAPATPPVEQTTAPEPAAEVRLLLRGLKLGLHPDSIWINVQLVNDSGERIRYRSTTVQARLLLERSTSEGWEEIYTDPPPIGKPEETRSLAPGQRINCGNGSTRLPNAPVRLRATVPYLPRGADEEVELVMIKELHAFE